MLLLYYSTSLKEVDMYKTLVTGTNIRLGRMMTILLTIILAAVPAIMLLYLVILAGECSKNETCLPEG
jgi:hypothetical protein